MGRSPEWETPPWPQKPTAIMIRCESNPLVGIHNLACRESMHDQRDIDISFSEHLVHSVAFLCQYDFVLGDKIDKLQGRTR